VVVNVSYPSSIIGNNSDVILMDLLCVEGVEARCREVSVKGPRVWECMVLRTWALTVSTYTPLCV